MKEYNINDEQIIIAELQEKQICFQFFDYFETA